MIKQAKEKNIESAYTSPTGSNYLIKNSSIATFKTNDGKNTIAQML